MTMDALPPPQPGYQYRAEPEADPLAVVPNPDASHEEEITRLLRNLLTQVTDGKYFRLDCTEVPQDPQYTPEELEGLRAAYGTDVDAFGTPTRRPPQMLTTEAMGRVQILREAASARAGFQSSLILRGFVRFETSGDTYAHAALRALLWFCVGILGEGPTSGPLAEAAEATRERLEELNLWVEVEADPPGLTYDRNDSMALAPRSMRASRAKSYWSAGNGGDPHSISVEWSSVRPTKPGAYVLRDETSGQTYVTQVYVVGNSEELMVADLARTMPPKLEHSYYDRVGWFPLHLLPYIGPPPAERCGCVECPFCNPTTPTAELTTTGPFLDTVIDSIWPPGIEEIEWARPFIARFVIGTRGDSEDSLAALAELEADPRMNDVVRSRAEALRAMLDGIVRLGRATNETVTMGAAT